MAFAVASKVAKAGASLDRVSRPPSTPVRRPTGVLGLQQLIGNRAAGLLLQPKLRVGPVNDVYEREADRVADTIMRTPRHECDCGGTCEECAAEPREEQTLQRAPDGMGGSQAPQVVHDVLRTPGEPLSSVLRSRLEPRLGHNLGHVRIHRDMRAAESANEVRALAYTVGQHIVFGQGRYQPDTPSGRRLLAHEIVHTIQQRGATDHGPLARTLQRAPQDTPDCSDVGATRWIRTIDVDQETPQRVRWTWSDGATDSARCSTGKGHCCVGPEAAEGAAATEAGTTAGGSNLTPVGNHLVRSRIRTTSGGVEFWTEFESNRSIALHQYSPVDGTPLSHGCVRMDRDPAIRIWCGSRENRTAVRVRGLPRPRCDHAALRREWLGDFREAGSRPPDGEQFDARTRLLINRTRSQLRSALGVNDAELTRRVEALRTETQGFRRPSTAGDLDAVARAIPRCLATQTVEEARIGAATATPAAGTPRAFIADAGFERFLSPLERDFRRSNSLSGAQSVVRTHGRSLWSAAVARAQAAAPDTDDRPVYWTRLAMSEIIRRTKPAWLEQLNPDVHRRAVEDLLDRFEQSSRGMDTATFAPERDVRRIVISGFDPFNLAAEARTSNPSGAAVLALDGQTITWGPVTARLQGVIFPVRFPDFNAGTVERFFGPHLGGARPAHMIVTISRGGSSVTELEEFAGRRRSTAFPANLGLSGGGTPARPLEPPGLGAGGEFLETTVSASALADMRSAVGRRTAIAGETQVEGIPPSGGAGRTISGSAAIAGGFTSVEGAGGGFLSNEIYYRVLRLVRAQRQPIPMIHLHTRMLDMTGAGAGDQRFINARNQIVRTVRSVLTAVLPNL